MGATDMLSRPTFSVVIPCMILGKANGSSIILKSEWLWLSMKPGHRILPPMSSTVRASGISWAEPTATMRPSRTPTQPLRQGVPVPSTMWALVKSRSSMNASPLSAEHDAARQSGQGADGAVGIEFGLVVPASHFPKGQRDAVQGRSHGVRRKAAGLRLIEQLEKTERGTGRPFRRGKTRGMM